jgi:hypothetical protein
MPQKQKTRPSEEEPGFWSVPTFTAFPPKTQREAYSGRYSGLRITLLLAPSHPFQDSGSSKFRPRLQRRGRPRLSRDSLFSSRPPEYGFNFNSKYHTSEVKVKSSSMFLSSPFPPPVFILRSQEASRTTWFAQAVSRGLPIKSGGGNLSKPVDKVPKILVLWGWNHC